MNEKEYTTIVNDYMRLEVEKATAIYIDMLKTQIKVWRLVACVAVAGMLGSMFCVLVSQ